MSTLNIAPEKLWTWVLVAGFVALGSVAAFDRLVPAPKAGNTSQERSAARKKLAIELDSATARADEVSKLNSSFTWSMAGDQVGPSALDQVSKSCAQRQIKLSSFRPQRAFVDQSLEGMGFVATLEGTFTSVAAFIKDMESSNSKLAVNMVQLASADGSTDAVTANIGFIAYAEVKNKEVSVARH